MSPARPSAGARERLWGWLKNVNRVYVWVVATAAGALTIVAVIVALRPAAPTYAMTLGPPVTGQQLSGFATVARRDLAVTHLRPRRTLAGDRRSGPIVEFVVGGAGDTNTGTTTAGPPTNSLTSSTNPPGAGQQHPDVRILLLDDVAEPGRLEHLGTSADPGIRAAGGDGSRSAGRRRDHACVRHPPQ